MPSQSVKSRNRHRMGFLATITLYVSYPESGFGFRNFRIMPLCAKLHRHKSLKDGNKRRAATSQFLHRQRDLR